MDQWFNGIITRMYELMHHFEPDNFDAERFIGVKPTTFYVDQHAPFFVFFERHRQDFFNGRELLADAASRDLFDQLILFRLLGHLHVKLPFNRPETSNYRAAVEPWKVDNTSDSGLLGPLSVFAVPVGDDILCMKCWHGNVAAGFLFRQYYFDRDGVRIAPEQGDTALDIGGCFGDTAINFAHSVGTTGHVHTFDPIAKHIDITRENLAMNPSLAERVTVLPFGLADVNHEGKGRQGIDPAARLGDDLATRTLDSLNISSVDFIKMDIEGSELAALRGGEQTIRRDRPKLAISLYHRVEDFFSIPQWLDSLRIGYRFHLDHYSIHSEETVLYAHV